MELFAFHQILCISFQASDQAVSAELLPCIAKAVCMMYNLSLSVT
jgi:hypothetical protein